MANCTGTGGTTGSVTIQNAKTFGYKMLFARIDLHAVSSAMKATLPYTLEGFRFVTVDEIPQKGGGAAATAVLNGTVTFLCTNSSALAGFVKNGQLVPLMVTTAEPAVGFDVPTAVDLGKPTLFDNNVNFQDYKKLFPSDPSIFISPC